MTDPPDKKVLALKQSLIPEVRGTWALMDEEARFAWCYDQLVGLRVQIQKLEGE